MSATVSRLSVLGENVYGDQEKDANSLLLELDKGLRSGKVGEQCEAIVRFPQLFEKYPFPILINSSFLKLADVFRVGSNFLRLCVLQVTQQSEKHLEKITSVDEFVRRIYTVIYSNDPVARALTLRTLGSVACIIADKKNVHHSIITSLDSHDEVELEAAIFAAALFAARSKSFVSSICGKLEEMIGRLSVPLDMKLKLISVFEHMRCDPDTYQRVRTLCTQMLEGYPSCKFVLAVLRTLTHLAACSVVDIPVQVELLLRYFSNDVRQAVKLAALRDLRLLAQRAPHMWTADHINCLCSVLKQDVSDDVLLSVMRVLAALSQTVAVANLTPETSLQLIDSCMSCYRNNAAIVALSTEMLVGLTATQRKDGVFPDTASQLLESVISAFEVALSVCVTDGKAEDSRKVLLSMIRLSRIYSKATDRFVDVIASCLGQVTADLGGVTPVPPDTDVRVLRALSLCDSLSVIGDLESGVLQALVPDLVAILKTVLQAFHRHNNAGQIVLAVTRLLMHACTDSGLPSDVLEVVSAVPREVNGWMAYKIGRQAARYSHHSLASDIFASLTAATSTEHFYFWLTALKDCCAGESCLQRDPPTTLSEFVEQLSTAEAHYHTGIVALKAAATPNHPLAFQIDYAQLRACMLPAFARVVLACCSFQTSPPPAIAASLAVTTNQEKHRCEHVLTQLRKCSQAFVELDQKYGALARSSFDADVATLSSIDLLQQTCRLMVHVIDVILSRTQNGDRADVQLSSVGSATADGAAASQMENSSWAVTRNQILELLRKAVALPTDVPLTDKHMECIQQITVLLARRRHGLPRYIFQRLQTTDIKLAISPSPRAAGEPISVHYDTRLTLKVEGVIQVGSHGVRRFHNVKSVELLVYSTQQSRSPTLHEAAKPQENPSNRMVETAVPHNDYFSVQFLLAFPVTGLHQVTVEASVVDASETRWSMGQRMTVLVKSYDEAMERQRQLHFAAQPRHSHMPGPSSRSLPTATTTSTRPV